MMSSFVVMAQFDDLYYDPVTDDDFYEDDYADDSDEYDYYYEDEDRYDDYEYMDDYYYSSRIRRFNRRSCGSLNFYNSWAFNSVFYDPFDYYNPWGGSYLSIGFGNPYIGFAYNPWGYNSYRNSWRRNNYWGGYNSWGGGYYNNYCPLGWGGGPYYRQGYANNVQVVNGYVQQSNPKGTYYGSRRSGSTSSSTKGVRDNPRGGSRQGGEILNPGVLGEDGSSRSVAAETSRLSHSPRRTSSRTDDLDVSRIEDRPGTRSAIDGTKRGSSATSARMQNERPSRRSVRRTVNPDSRAGTSSSAPRRSSNATQKTSERPSARTNRNYSPNRSYNNSSSRSGSRSSSSSSRNMSRSSSPARSSARSSSGSSSKPSSGSSSPRRKG